MNYFSFAEHIAMQTFHKYSSGQGLDKGWAGGVSALGAQWFIAGMGCPEPNPKGRWAAVWHLCPGHLIPPVPALLRGVSWQSRTCSSWIILQFLYKIWSDWLQILLRRNFILHS